MQYAELVSRVQAKAGLGRKDQAEGLLRAVLTALAQRTTGGLAHNFTAQLPEELRAAVPTRAPQTLGEGAEAFVRRVGEIWQTSDGTPPVAACVKACLDALTEAVSPGQTENLLGQLPADLDRMVRAEVAGAGAITARRP